MLFMRKGGRKLLVASPGVGAISYVACGGSVVANLMAPPQQDAGAEHRRTPGRTARPRCPTRAPNLVAPLP
jgi:hypothetical protein